MDKPVDGLTSQRPAAMSGVNSLQLVKFSASEKLKAESEVAPDKAALQGAVQKLNDYVAPALQTIQFAIDDDTDRMVVKVVDTETQKVLRQVPNEEVLAISKTLDKLRGLVIRQTV